MLIKLLGDKFNLMIQRTLSFAFAEALLKKLKLDDEPTCIFNADETGISSQSSNNSKAYGQKGQPLYQQKVCTRVITISSKVEQAVQSVKYRKK